MKSRQLGTWNLELGTLLVFLFAIASHAADVDPFYTHNQSPLIQAYGLPPPGDARVAERGHPAWRVVLDWANHYEHRSRGRERITFDGETTRVTLDLRTGLGRRAEVGLAVPFVAVWRGTLDNFIEDYHAFWGMPQGGRDEVHPDRLLFRYEKDGKVLLDVEDESEGVGDVALLGGWQVFGGVGSDHAVALRTSLKLPTGDSGNLHGSGSTDLALWAVGDRRFEVAWGSIVPYASAGVLGMTEGDILPDQQRNLVGFGSLGIGWSPTWWAVFKVQADANTAFYDDSDLREVGEPSIQIATGGTWYFTRNIGLDIGVVEDVYVATSADVVFHFALRGSL